jgi:hypothetical protein
VAVLRAALEPYQASRLPGMEERAKHVLDAHKVLAATSEENARKFAGVVGILEKEVAEHERKTD